MIENIFVVLVIAAGVGTAAFGALVLYRLFKTRA